MNEEEKEAMEYLKEVQEVVLKNVDDEDIIVDCRIVGRIQILLNLIDKQQKEIDKQNKVIDDMTNDIYGSQIECNRYFKDKEEVKQYFIRKVEEDE